MTDTFKFRKNACDLRKIHLFESQNPKTKRYGLDFIVYVVSQIRQTFPIEIRDLISLKIFEQKIKTWDSNSCLCYCCKPYIHHLLFI